MNRMMNTWPGIYTHSGRESELEKIDPCLNLDLRLAP